jgi:adenylate cyclase
MSGTTTSDRSQGRRKLIAVVHADMVGYSRLIGLDDVGTLGRLRTLRSTLIDPAIAEHGGRVVNAGGDSLLIVFDSIDGAVRCAMKVQQQMPVWDGDQPTDRAVRFRVGINVGDVIPDGTDVHGEVVNVAARLQAECPPGGLCVSRAVRDHVRDRPDLVFEELGALNLKNIARPVEAFVLKLDTITASQSGGRLLLQNSLQALPLPDRPSIAVLAFTNMSDDPDQEYFSDGISDDIITELSRSRSLFVIARNSSFTYKGKTVDVRQVGRELGVRYLVEGSVRRSGGRVRITSQLIDASTAGNIWAERFEGDVADVFELQDRVAERVVAAIEPSLQRVEAIRASLKPTDNLDAYDCYLRALLHFHTKTKASVNEAVAHLRQALEFDSRYALAKGFLAYLLFIRSALGWGQLCENDIAVTLAREALTASPDDPVMARWVAHPLVQFARDYELALLILHRAVRLSPHSAQLLRTAGVVLMICGQPIEAIDYCQRAMRLSPLDPEMPIMEMEYGMALVIAGRDEEALHHLNQAVAEMPTLAPAYRFLIIAFWRLNRLDEMHATAKKLLTADPSFRISTHVRPHRNIDFVNLYVKALRAAELPE